MSYLRIKQKHCLNCQKRIIHQKHVYKYCSRECCVEYYRQQLAVGSLQFNILTALSDTQGIRWLPKSASLYAMAYCRHTPWVEIIEEKVHVLGKTTDCLTRLTVLGLEHIAELGLYAEKEAV